jgi:hypothetical protein
MVDDSVIDYEAIDEEIRGLCMVINSIPGLQTTSSCYGHGRWPLHIYLKIASIRDLNLLLWGGCHRFFNLNQDCLWDLRLSGGDPNRTDPYIRALLTTKDHCPGLAVLQGEIDELVDGLSAYAPKAQLYRDAPNATEP